MVALIAARHLKRAPCGGKLSDVDVLDVRAIDAERNVVFGFAGGGAGVTPDASSVVDNLSPEDRLGHGREPITMGSDLHFALFSTSRRREKPRFWRICERGAASPRSTICRKKCEVKL